MIEGAIFDMDGLIVDTEDIHMQARKMIFDKYGFDMKKILKIPESVRVVTMTPVGYPSQPPSQGSRKNLKQIICFEQYS